MGTRTWRADAYDARMDDDDFPQRPAPDLAQPALWRAAQAQLATELAGAAMAVGRLDALLAASGADAAGAIRRTALIEVEEIMWAQGTPLPRDEIGRDLMEARAGTDLDAMAQARWAIRRLEGRGDPADLRGFLGLHRLSDADLTLPGARPVGADFDASAAALMTAAGGYADLHPLARAPALRLLWRRADLSPPELLAESAVWTARQMAQGCEALPFVPLSRHGRGVWIESGDPLRRLARQLDAVRRGADGARVQMQQLTAWAAQARAATAPIKGHNLARVIAVLVARPLASAAMVEQDAGISRMTAERLLMKMQTMGLIREVTGARRFRLWTVTG